MTNILYNPLRSLDLDYTIIFIYNAYFIYIAYYHSKTTARYIYKKNKKKTEHTSTSILFKVDAHHRHSKG